MGASLYLIRYKQYLAISFKTMDLQFLWYESIVVGIP